MIRNLLVGAVSLIAVSAFAAGSPQARKPSAVRLRACQFGKKLHYRTKCACKGHIRRLNRSYRICEQATATVSPTATVRPTIRPVIRPTVRPLVHATVPIKPGVTYDNSPGGKLSGPLKDLFTRGRSDVCIKTPETLQGLIKQALEEANRVAGQRPCGPMLAKLLAILRKLQQNYGGGPQLFYLMGSRQQCSPDW